ncbi:MAG: cystathionine beta-synthase, partial [Bacteroidia bacterium]|nr:cystathionine beta-synthase [Bacteroidia bacterium]
ELFASLIDKPELKSGAVSAVMQAPFPFVKATDNIEVVSKLISRENPAVLMMDMAGNTHIITKYDIIDSITN